MRCQVSFQPLLLRRTGAASAHLAAVRIEGNDVPGTNIVAVISFRLIPRGRTKVTVVAIRARSVVFVVSNGGADNILDPAPAGIERLLEFFQRSIFILSIAKRKDSCIIFACQQVGGCLLTAGARCAAAALEIAIGGITGDVTRRGDDRVAARIDRRGGRAGDRACRRQTGSQSRLSSSAVIVERIEIRAVTGTARPFLGTFDRSPFAPFVEGRDQLPRCAGGDHVLDVLRPAVEITRQADRSTLLPEPRRDRIGVALLAVRGDRGAVLMPAIWLTGTVTISIKNLEYHIRAHSIRLLPAVCHAAGVAAVSVNEYHKATVDPQETRIVAVAVAQIGQITLKLCHGRIPRTLVLVINRPAKGRRCGCLEQSWHLGILSGPLAPPGSDPCLDAAILHGNDLPSDHS